MLLQTMVAVALIGTQAPVASPEPTIPTIVRVHSSPYCTALGKTVSPALIGLMRNDDLIAVGRSAMLSMDHDFKYNGIIVSSWGSTGAGSVQQMPGRVKNFDNRLQQTASALQHNLHVIEGILAKADTALKPANAGEQVSLASIKANLAKVADQQKTAINLINGTAETRELDGIFNDATTVAPSDAIAVQPWHADTPDGVSPLKAMMSKGEPAIGVAGDPSLTVSMLQAKAQASQPFHSPYERFAQALTDDQLLIGSYENAASKSIIAGAAGCK